MMFLTLMRKESSLYVQGIWTYTPPSDNITVRADNNESVDELDEDNNCLTNIWMCGDVRKDGSVTAWDVAVLNSKVAGIGAISCMCTQPDI